MRENTMTVNYQSFDNFKELSQEDQLLCSKAEEAMRTSYSPYSNFKVGTSIKLASGEIILGSNQENVAYPSGLCAERVALFAIGASKPDAVIESMAITAFTKNFKIESPVTSCGSCLQVMAEFEKKQNSPIEVLFYCLDGKILKVSGIKNLLPFVFVEERLSIKA